VVIHVEYGQRICFLKKVAYNIINDLAENKAGTLSIGLTPERGINMLMSIYPEFHKQFPNIKIEPTEIGVHKQQNMVNKGDLDIGFVTVTPKDKNNDDYDHILYEDIFLAVPRSHPLAKNASAPGEPFTTIDLKAFRDEYFVLMFKSSTMRTLIDPLFEEAGFQPKILFETASNVISKKKAWRCGLRVSESVPRLLSNKRSIYSGILSVRLPSSSNTSSCGSSRASTPGYLPALTSS
jgi:DNA-binding transcriptional LysR family regulator